MKGREIVKKLFPIKPKPDEEAFLWVGLLREDGVAAVDCGLHRAELSSMKYDPEQGMYLEIDSSFENEGSDCTVIGVVSFYPDGKPHTVSPLTHGPRDIKNGDTVNLGSWKLLFSHPESVDIKPLRRRLWGQRVRLKA